MIQDMARPLRIEYAGALYHIVSRGDRREDIYLDDEDRENWLTVLGRVCERFNWVVHAYCEMSNHYHIIVETVDGNLSRGMRQLNGHYTQLFNRKHNLAGHLYQGRFKAILVQKESYLLELSRYIVLNPVRAKMVLHPGDWQWSSYRAMVGKSDIPEWLDRDWLLSQFGSHRSHAIAAYGDFVMKGVGRSSPLLSTRHQLLLGDDGFIKRHQDNLKKDKLRELSKAHKRSLALSLFGYQQKYPNRNEAMSRAYLSGAYTMAKIAEHFNVHYMTVSRAVRQFEK